MQELIPINVVIGDRSYRVKIYQKDEEVVRKTLKTINDKIIEFKTQFAGKDMQDYVAMVILWFATQSYSNHQAIPEGLSSIFSKLEDQLDKVL